ncbi:glycosyl hydrolase 2 galactose-binding domain-containing protein [Leifsonia xyli]|uniref:glycosyl hydrolase 2 galactose-binding domain-containing protein n=1 Tax=Leifsonia xyli TaxID=1575 RepID=UPI003D66F2A4
MSTSTTIGLDGDWTIREALGDTAEWYLGAPLPEAGNNVAEASAAIAAAPGWLPARVPGAVIDDLHRAGELPDPRVGRNSRAAEWVAERSWVYRRAVDLEADASDGVAVLELDGVDPGADVYWDGELLGSVRGLYHRARLPLTAAQRAAGRHKLALRVHPAPDSEPQVGRTERVRVHTPRLGYGWDFTPRLRHQGVWKGVRIRYGRGLLGDVVVRARVAPASRASSGESWLESASSGEQMSQLGGVGSAARAGLPSSGESWLESASSGEQMSQLGGREPVASGASGESWSQLAASGEQMSRVGAVSVAWEAPRGAGTSAATVRVAVRRDGRTLAAVTADAGDGSAEVRIPDPELWWPNTVGGQPLYDVIVTLADEAGEMDAVTRTVGFRTADLVPNPGAPGGALPFTAVVNGVRVPLLGWNWTPADTLFGSIDDARIEHMLRLAAESGARLIRVWGGGLIETEHFYATCDRLGLLVWQEFSQSSSGMQSAPSTDPAFVELMRAEAEALIPTRVHHPSLMLWGGGNELDEGGVPLSDERSPVLAVLSEAVARLDPDRGWLPTSPTGPEFHNRLDRIHANPDGQHDVHGPWEHQGLVGQYTLANAGTSLAHTEFGVEGMTNLRSLEALVPEGDRWPADRTNPVYRHLGEWWNNADQVIGLFGGRPDALETLNRASQLLQATGLQYAVEADRRRAPRSSMVLPWQLNESFPNAWCTAAVDFRGDPKPAFFAVARAFGRRRATLRVARAVWAGESTASAEAWLWAEDAVAAGSTVALRAIGLDGRVFAERTLTAGAVGDPVAVGSLEVAVGELPDVFLWEAEWRDAAGAIDRERMVATTTTDFAALLDLPAPVLDVVRGDDGAVSVRNAGDIAALTVRLVDPRPAGAPGVLTVAGDPRPLLPGEERILAAAPGLPVRLEVWNGGSVDL